MRKNVRPLYFYCVKTPHCYYYHFIVVVPVLIVFIQFLSYVILFPLSKMPLMLRDGSVFIIRLASVPLHEVRQSGSHQPLDSEGKGNHEKSNIPFRISTLTSNHVGSSQARL